MRLINVAFKNMRRRRLRSALTIAGVSIAVAAVVALVGAVGSFERQLLAVFQNRGIDLVVAGATTVQRLQSSLDEDLGRRIAQLPGVKHAACALIENFSFPELDVLGVVVRGLEPNSFVLNEIALIDGRSLEPGDNDVMLMGKMLANTLSKRVGDRFELVPGRSFRIVGVFDSFNLLESNSLVVPLAALQDLMDRRGKATVFMVVAADGSQAAVESLAAQIKPLAPNIDVLPARQYVDSLIEVRLARAVAWFTSTLALIVGTIGVVNTMLTAVFERTRELAVLRAVGWRRATIVKMILFESALLSILGAVVGCAMAWGLTQMLRLTPTGRLISGEIGWDIVAQGFALALLVGIAGGSYPAWRAARLLPTEGLRHE